MGTYIQGFLSGMDRQANGLSVGVLIRPRDAALLKDFSGPVTVVDVPIYTVREQIAIPWAARDVDLLHVPHYNVPVFYGGKLLVSIHDLIHITDPVYRRSLEAWFYARPMLAMAVRKARHIITVSEYSKAMIVERLAVSPSRVTVIYCGIHPRFLRSEYNGTGQDWREPSERWPYLLYVGALKPHKNVSALLRAYALLRERKVLDEHRLVIVGDDPKWGVGLRQEALHLNLGEHVRFIPFVHSELLPEVYASAEMLVLPSFLEGFGLPVVEAMACGTPVVCSRASSLPEVAGNAAEFFEPSSVEDMAEAMRRVLESTELRRELRERGRQRARLFSWEECARAHFEVYRRLVDL